ncbi:MAG: acyl--CoA ligase [Clostridiales bacterium]|nr:acyl--CoA ligase [Clostridiales bacterium]
MTLYESFKACAEANPQKTAMVFYGGRIKFSKLLEYVNRAANGLKEFVKKDDVVTLCVPNSPSAAIALYAVNKLGAIANLVHPLSKKDSVVDCMKKVGSKLLITYDQFEGKNDVDCNVLISDSSYFMSGIAGIYYRAAFRKKIGKYDKSKRFENLLRYPELIETQKPTRAAVYLPSGGSTGEPKIIMHSDEAFNRLCDHVEFFLSQPVKNYNAMYSVLPIFHGFGLCMNLHICMTKCFTSVMTLKFNAKSMTKAIKKEGVNILTGVPAMFTKLLACNEFLKADLSSIKDCFVGGDSAPQELVDRFNEVLKRGGSSAKLHVGYGLTETVTVCAVTNAKYDREGSAGYPLPGTRFCITDGHKKLGIGEVGELCIRTPIMMLGYYGTDESPIKMLDGEEWLFTGDLCYLDSDGYLFFKQRQKNMIKVSGVPVFPSEVENVVTKIDGVKNAAAIGIPDAQKGEVVKLFVEKADGVNDDELIARIKAECKDKLIVYAVPKQIVICTLPLNAIGKVDRKLLK